MLVEHKMNVEDRMLKTEVVTNCLHLACSCVWRIDAELNGELQFLISEKCFA